MLFGKTNTQLQKSKFSLISIKLPIIKTGSLFHILSLRGWSLNWNYTVFIYILIRPYNLLFQNFVKIFISFIYKLFLFGNYRGQGKTSQSVRFLWLFLTPSDLTMLENNQLFSSWIVTFLLISQLCLTMFNKCTHVVTCLYLPLSSHPPFSQNVISKDYNRGLILAPIHQCFLCISV